MELKDKLRCKMRSHFFLKLLKILVKLAIIKVCTTKPRLHISVVALAKKMAKPDTKTVTRTISIPKKNYQTACSATSQTRSERRSSNCYQAYYLHKTSIQLTFPPD